MRILLHICCGVCAAGVVERLTLEGHQVHGLFYNPSIHPRHEYARRLEVARKVAKELNFPLEVPPYTPEEWLKETIYLANEPEGGRRCEVCFRLRLKRAYLYMKDCGADAFTTTLTISPHKSAAVINRVGREIGGERFLVITSLTPLAPLRPFMCPFHCLLNLGNGIGVGRTLVQNHDDIGAK